MPHRICPTHGLVPTNERCCPTRNDQRRAQASVELGRNTAHWRRLRASTIYRAHGRCSRCGQEETEHDAGSKLTVDLTAGGDHSRATLDEVQALCKRCHGRSQGARRTTPQTRYQPAGTPQPLSPRRSASVSSDGG